jgi:hypothetical protein
MNKENNQDIKYLSDKKENYSFVNEISISDI